MEFPYVPWPVVDIGVGDSKDLAVLYSYWNVVKRYMCITPTHTHTPPPHTHFVVDPAQFLSIGEEFPGSICLRIAMIALLYIFTTQR